MVKKGHEEGDETPRALLVGGAACGGGLHGKEPKSLQLLLPLHKEITASKGSFRKAGVLPAPVVRDRAWEGMEEGRTKAILKMMAAVKHWTLSGEMRSLQVPALVTQKPRELPAPVLAHVAGGAAAPCPG